MLSISQILSRNQYNSCALWHFLINGDSLKFPRVASWIWSVEYRLDEVMHSLKSQESTQLLIPDTSAADIAYERDGFRLLALLHWATQWHNVPPLTLRLALFRIFLWGYHPFPL